jgi:aspartate oxidase
MRLLSTLTLLSSEKRKSCGQVRPSTHAVNGGVLIDERAATTMHGLYAAGEVAAGPHGADRLDGGW